MHITRLLLFVMTLLCSTHVYSMNPNTIDTNNKHIKNIWTTIIALCEAKNSIRKTCTYFRDIASEKNEPIFMHPSLVLKEKTLEKFILYYGALGHSEIVHNLLAIGANPNACDNKSVSLIHCAAQCGHVDIVDALLQAQNLNTNNVMLAYLSAVRNDQHTIVERIFSTYIIPNNGEALCYAAKHGAFNTAHILLNTTHLNIKSNYRDTDGNYPITYAAIAGNTSIIKLLIEKGANINCNSHDSKTPLHCACEGGHIGIIEMLLQNNAHVNAKTNDGRTPLDCAKNDAVKELLMQHGGKTSAHLESESEQIGPKNKRKKDNCVMQ